MITFPDFMNDLLDAGIEINICKSKELGVYFDLNLKSKSWLYLYKLDDDWRVSMRYNEDWLITGIEDLKFYAKLGMHGRDYINPAWANFIGLNDDEGNV